MNQWQPISLKLLCNTHLNGLHGEHHKHAPGFASGKSVKGYIDNHCIAPATYRQRHDEAEAEMNRRKACGEMGGKPINSPLKVVPTFNHLPPEQFNFTPDLQYNLDKLIARCDECAKRIKQE